MFAWLKKLRHKWALNALVTKLDGACSDDVGEATATALGNLGDRRAVGPLVRVLAYYYNKSLLSRIYG